MQVHKSSQKSGRTAPSSDDKSNGSKPSSRSTLGLDKPRQIFWEKRLSGLQPSYEDDLIPGMLHNQILSIVSQKIITQEKDLPCSTHFDLRRGNATKFQTNISKFVKILLVLTAAIFREIA